MRLLLSILATVLMLCFISGISVATPITFTDTTSFTATGTDPTGDLDGYGGDYVNKLEKTFDYVSWTHHFTFNPAADTILSGSLVLSFEDDNPNEGDGGFLGWRNEWALGYAEDGTWDIGEIDLGDYNYDVSISSLVDGSFSITLLDLYGDFIIKSSALTITYNPVDDTNNTPVPEPATMVLLGTGLIGLAGATRKKIFKKS